MISSVGTVYLIGAGPGAADLITLRAARILERADIVYHDALVPPEILDMAPRAKRVPVGKRCGKHSTTQRFINKQLVDAAQRFQTIVRLKGGDPMIFGRAQEEIDALEKAHIPYQIVPGITTALAASASLGLSLTQRNVARSVALVTPRTGVDCSPTAHWLHTACAADSVVLYMAGHQLQAIQEALLSGGRSASTPVVLLANVSHPDEARWTGLLESLHQCPLPEQTSNPIVMLLGEAFSKAVTLDKSQTLTDQIHSTLSQHCTVSVA